MKKLLKKMLSLNLALLLIFSSTWVAMGENINLMYDEDEEIAPTFSLNTKSVRLAMNGDQSFQLIATKLTDAAINIEWDVITDPEGCVTVDSGLLKAVKNGSATIIAFDLNSGYSVEVSVTVKDVTATNGAAVEGGSVGFVEGISFGSDIPEAPAGKSAVSVSGAAEPGDKAYIAVYDESGKMLAADQAELSLSGVSSYIYIDSSLKSSVKRTSLFCLNDNNKPKAVNKASRTFTAESTASSVVLNEGEKSEFYSAAGEKIESFSLENSGLTLSVESVEKSGLSADEKAEYENDEAAAKESLSDILKIWLIMNTDLDSEEAAAKAEEASASNIKAIDASLILTEGGESEELHPVGETLVTLTAEDLGFGNALIPEGTTLYAYHTNAKDSTETSVGSVSSDRKTASFKLNGLSRVWINIVSPVLVSFKDDSGKNLGSFYVGFGGLFDSSLISFIPEKAGYSFAGWKKGDTAFDIEREALYENTVFKPIWVENPALVEMGASARELSSPITRVQMAELLANYMEFDEKTLEDDTYISKLYTQYKRWLKQNGDISKGSFSLMEASSGEPRILLRERNISLYIGNSAKVYYLLVDCENYSPELEWSVEQDGNIISLGNDGTFYGIEVGSARIKLSLKENSEIYAYCNVIVEKKKSSGGGGSGGGGSSVVIVDPTDDDPDYEYVPTVEKPDYPFADCADLTTRQKNIIGAVRELGFMLDTDGDLHFSPLNMLTKAQVAQILSRMLYLDADSYSDIKSGFSDVSMSNWYNRYLAALEAYGLFAPKTSERFEPNLGITIGEALEWIEKLKELKEKKSDKKYVVRAYYESPAAFLEAEDIALYREMTSPRYNAEVEITVNKELLLSGTSNNNYNSALSMPNSLVPGDTVYITKSQGSGKNSYKIEVQRLFGAQLDVDTDVKLSDYEAGIRAYITSDLMHSYYDYSMYSTNFIYYNSFSFRSDMYMALGFPLADTYLIYGNADKREMPLYQSSLRRVRGELTKVSGGNGAPEIWTVGGKDYLLAGAYYNYGAQLNQVYDIFILGDIVYAAEIQPNELCVLTGIKDDGFFDVSYQVRMLSLTEGKVEQKVYDVAEDSAVEASAEFIYRHSMINNANPVIAEYRLNEAGEVCYLSLCETDAIVLEEGVTRTVSKTGAVSGHKLSKDLVGFYNYNGEVDGWRAYGYYDLIGADLSGTTLLAGDGDVSIMLFNEAPFRPEYTVGMLLGADENTDGSYTVNVIEEGIEKTYTMNNEEAEYCSEFFDFYKLYSLPDEEPYLVSYIKGEEGMISELWMAYLTTAYDEESRAIWPSDGLIFSGYSSKDYEGASFVSGLYLHRVEKKSGNNFRILSTNSDLSGANVIRLSLNAAKTELEYSVSNLASISVGDYAMLLNLKDGQKWDTVLYISAKDRESILEKNSIFKASELSAIPDLPSDRFGGDNSSVKLYLDEDYICYTLAASSGSSSTKGAIGLYDRISCYLYDDAEGVWKKYKTSLFDGTEIAEGISVVYNSVGRPKAIFIHSKPMKELMENVIPESMELTGDESDEYSLQYTAFIEDYSYGIYKTAESVGGSVPGASELYEKLSGEGDSKKLTPFITLVRDWLGKVIRIENPKLKSSTSPDDSSLESYSGLIFSENAGLLDADGYFTEENILGGFKQIYTVSGSNIKLEEEGDYQYVGDALSIEIRIGEENGKPYLNGFGSIRKGNYAVLLQLIEDSGTWDTVLYMPEYDYELLKSKANE